MEQVYGTLVVFGSIACVILLPIYWRAQMRRRVLETVKEMANSGSAMSPDLVLSLMGPIQPSRPSRELDLRRGFLLVALAIGLGLIGLAIYSTALLAGANDPKYVGIGVAATGAIPGCVGIAFILLGLGQRRD